MLITGDEESVAVNGTIKLLKWAAERGEVFDHCILGEPSNLEVLGDTIKAGRRGSLNGTLVVTGRQGHVAYPDRADNPIRGLVTLIEALQAPLDDGSAHFDPSNLEFTSVDVGNAASNVIPGQARARFNIRFNDLHTGSWIKGYVYNIPPTRLIQVDIDPEEIGRNYPVEMGMVGDAKAFLAQAARVARGKGMRLGYGSAWQREIDGWRADWRNFCEPFERSSSRRMTAMSAAASGVRTKAGTLSGSFSIAMPLIHSWPVAPQAQQS